MLGTCLAHADLDRPLIGVATTWSESSPCNMPLHDQAQHVKAGIREAGGTPFEFTSASVTDGIAMGHPGMKTSLVSRELVADSIEPGEPPHPLAPSSAVHGSTPSRTSFALSVRID